MSGRPRAADDFPAIRQAMKDKGFWRQPTDTEIAADIKVGQALTEKRGCIFCGSLDAHDQDMLCTGECFGG